MNVAVLTTCSRKAGGLFYSVRGLSKALAELDCGPMIYSPVDEFTKEDLPVWKPLPVKTYSAFGPLRTSFELRKELVRADADLLHLHGIWLDSQWAAMQLQQKQGTPVVVSPRGMLDPWAVNNAAWKKRLVGKLFARRALEQASCVHALCRSELESIRAYGLKNPVAVIPNGIDLPDLVEPVERNGKKRLLFLGRLHPKKGLNELLRAWAQVPNDWELVIAGWDDGGYELAFKNLAEELKIEVSFVGPQFGEEKDALLRSVDAFILPSFSEGLPMSVLEAWSYGLPVIMTPACNLPEGITAGAAVSVEPETESISQGIAAFFRLSDSDRVGIGMKGRRLVEERFTWAAIAEDMKHVYEWCSGGGEPPACVEF